MRLADRINYNPWTLKNGWSCSGRAFVEEGDECLLPRARSWRAALPETILESSEQYWARIARLEDEANEIEWLVEEARANGMPELR